MAVARPLDLLADPRCVIHTTVDDKADTQGEVTVNGRARDVADSDGRERYGAALEQAVGWRPEAEFHLFTVDVTEVGYFAVVDGGHDVRTWRP